MVRTSSSRATGCWSGCASDRCWWDPGGGSTACSARWPPAGWGWRRASRRHRGDGHQGSAVSHPRPELGHRHRAVSVVGGVPTRFPTRLDAGAPRVFKQRRGNGGLGVSGRWDPVAGEVRVAATRMVRVQHAAPRDDSTELLSLDGFMRRCEQYFVGDGTLVDQPFIVGVVERRGAGLSGRGRPWSATHVSCPTRRPAVRPTPPIAFLGMPSGKTTYGADEPQFAPLRRQLETDWVPALCGTLGLDISPVAAVVGRRLPDRATFRRLMSPPTCCVRSTSARSCRSRPRLPTRLPLRCTNEDGRSIERGTGPQARGER